MLSRQAFVEIMEIKFYELRSFKKVGRNEFQLGAATKQIF